jgi:hypothetical protein
MGRPVVVISGRHRPHELLFLALGVLLGAVYTLGAPPPESLAASLPSWALKVWAVGLLAHGLVGLFGAIIPTRYSLELEQASMLLGAAALVWYTGAVLPFGWRASLAVGFSVAWAGANLWRAAQIRRDLRSTL